MMKWIRSLKWKHLYDGMGLGATLLAPGLSVATIAMILGIYETLLESVSDFFSSKWKEALRFLMPLGIGALVALMASSVVITYLLDHHRTPTYFLFLGLVIGAMPLLFKTGDVKATFKGVHWSVLAVVMLLVASLAFIGFEDAGDSIYQLDAEMMSRLGVTGALAGAAMLLPGLSASLMLLLMGTYSTLSHALSTLDLPVIIVVVIGVMLGLVISSRSLKFLLNRYVTVTYAVSIGMVLGSIVVIYQKAGFPQSLSEGIASLLTFGIGLFGVMFLNRKKVSSMASK